ncbi:putative serine/threonine protein kinase IRE [Porphyridium purpureum]|uniref:non-specific serine/threonine protein kinase n=1 Tax=Porphyridium purpureum TaxID=35688 RepID=A0A5J4YYQ9_PORPP|nr:putative serine/threonine protein kinase IRE [Porphyridium purpureum]|eukprot:POR1541..scf209_3
MEEVSAWEGFREGREHGKMDGGGGYLLSSSDSDDFATGGGGLQKRGSANGRLANDLDAGAAAQQEWSSEEDDEEFARAGNSSEQLHRRASAPHRGFRPSATTRRTRETVKRSGTATDARLPSGAKLSPHDESAAQHANKYGSLQSHALNMQRRQRQPLAHADVRQPLHAQSRMQQSHALEHDGSSHGGTHSAVAFRGSRSGMFPNHRGGHPHEQVQSLSSEVHTRRPSAYLPSFRPAPLQLQQQQQQPHLQQSPLVLQEGLRDDITPDTPDAFEADFSPDFSVETPAAAEVDSELARVVKDLDTLLAQIETYRSLARDSQESAYYEVAYERVVDIVDCCASQEFSALPSIEWDLNTASSQSDTCAWRASRGISPFVSVKALLLELIRTVSKQTAQAPGILESIRAQNLRNHRQVVAEGGHDGQMHAEVYLSSSDSEILRRPYTDNSVSNARDGEWNDGRPDVIREDQQKARGGSASRGQAPEHVAKIAGRVAEPHDMAVESPTLMSSDNSSDFEYPGLSQRHEVSRPAVPDSTVPSALDSLTSGVQSASSVLLLDGSDDNGSAQATHTGLAPPSPRRLSSDSSAAPTPRVSTTPGVSEGAIEAAFQNHHHHSRRSHASLKKKSSNSSSKIASGPGEHIADVARIPGSVRFPDAANAAREVLRRRRRKAKRPHTRRPVEYETSPLASPPTSPYANSTNAFQGLAGARYGPPRDPWNSGGLVPHTSTQSHDPMSQFARTADELSPSLSSPGVVISGEDDGSPLAMARRSSPLDIRRPTPSANSEGWMGEVSPEIITPSQHRAPFSPLGNVLATDRTLQGLPDSSSGYQSHTSTASENGSFTRLSVLGDLDDDTNEVLSKIINESILGLSLGARDQPAKTAEEEMAERIQHGNAEDDLGDGTCAAVASAATAATAATAGTALSEPSVSAPAAQTTIDWFANEPTMMQRTTQTCRVDVRPPTESEQRESTSAERWIQCRVCELHYVADFFVVHAYWCGKVARLLQDICVGAAALSTLAENLERRVAHPHSNGTPRSGEEVGSMRKMIDVFRTPAAYALDIDLDTTEETIESKAVAGSNGGTHGESLKIPGGRLSEHRFAKLSKRLKETVDFRTEVSRRDKFLFTIVQSARSVLQHMRKSLTQLFSSSQFHGNAPSGPQGSGINGSSNAAAGDTELEQWCQGVLRSLDRVVPILKLLRDASILPSLRDFTIIKPISRGAFGRVYLARKKKTRDVFAIKVLNKEDMVLKNLVGRVQGERDILAGVSDPTIVRFFWSFHTQNKLYLAMEFVPGGDMYSLLCNLGFLDEKIAKQYLAELVLALEYLHHHCSVVHRDLKPDNLLIASDGRIKLADFGLSKFHVPAKQNDAELHDENVLFSDMKMTMSMLTDAGALGSVYIANHQADNAELVGTPDYLAPELLLGLGHSFTADWWSVGVILYEFLMGIPPFHDSNPDMIFENILQLKIEWPAVPSEMSEEALDLAKRLLDPNPRTRLGANGAGEVKQHAFFADVDWSSVRSKKALFVPDTISEEDTSYFNSRNPFGPLSFDEEPTGKPYVLKTSMERPESRAKPKLMDKLKGERMDSAVVVRRKLPAASGVADGASNASKGSSLSGSLNGMEKDYGSGVDVRLGDPDQIPLSPVMSRGAHASGVDFEQFPQRNITNLIAKNLGLIRKLDL